MSDRWRIVIRRTGGPEVLVREELGPLEPGPGELLVRHEAIGLNFIDTYHRTGLYPVTLPSGLGTEGAGIIEGVGEGVESLSIGDRIGYVSRALGAYSTHRLVPADRAIKLPKTVSSEVAAAAMLKGCTAEYLIHRCAKVQSGDSVLVHAAAGGVGSILVPWLKAVGAIVIAHSGTPEKAKRAATHGADHSLSCPLDELGDEVRRLTGGTGVTTVLDGVGAASWKASLKSIARRGLLVTYGNASGPVPPISLADLTGAGSIFITRPGLFDYTATRDELQLSTGRLFEMIEKGVVRIDINARFPLADAADAHRALESRATTGSTVLIP
jgi:NADPH2:quinone reductase